MINKTKNTGNRRGVIIDDDRLIYKPFLYIKFQVLLDFTGALIQWKDTEAYIYIHTIPEYNIITQ